MTRARVGRILTEQAAYLDRMRAAGKPPTQLAVRAVDKEVLDRMLPREYDRRGPTLFGMPVVVRG